MAIEQMRQCGYRKVNGLYLVGEGLGVACDRLPYELTVCPVCGGGVKFARGWTWLNWYKFAGTHAGLHALIQKCRCPGLSCPVCHPLGQIQPYGLLWVGEVFYTPQSFIKEALEMGVSKRIAAVPKNLKLGETWVLFAHKRAMRIATISIEGKNEWVPGVFYAFRPQSLELLIWESEATPEKLTGFKEKGITPIIIPNGDIDHDPATKLKVTDEDHIEIERSRFFGGLRSNLQKEEY